MDNLLRDVDAIADMEAKLDKIDQEEATRAVAAGGATHVEREPQAEASPPPKPKLGERLAATINGPRVEA
jgi:hypothetical protein